mgnify:CR=1 FL=1
MSRISEALQSIGSQDAVTFESLRRLGEAIEKEFNERDAAIKRVIESQSATQEQNTSLAPPVQDGGGIVDDHN